MSKNYNEVTSQIAAYQTKDHTLSFYAELEPASAAKFAELIGGKIKMYIYDFSKGKGDNAVSGYYNLELKDIYYLYQCAKFFNMPPYRLSKIHGAYPIQEGQDKGLAKAFHLTIQRNSVDNNGQPKRSPWNITISNGVAVPKKGRTEGTYYEQSGTFQERSCVYFNMSDVDFLECMTNIYNYINNYRFIVAQKLIPEGLRAIDENNKRNSYQQEQPNGSQGQQMQPAETAYSNQKSSNTMPQSNVNDVQLHLTKLLIQSDFQALGGGQAVAQCIANGKTFTIFFDMVTDELIEAQKRQTPVTVYLYMDMQNNFRCCGTAA